MLRIVILAVAVVVPLIPATLGAQRLSFPVVHAEVALRHAPPSAIDTLGEWLPFATRYPAIADAGRMGWLVATILLCTSPST